MGEIYYEKEEYFKPIYQTSLALMRERGYDTQCDIISCGDWQIVNTEYDNWNGGTYGYTLYVNLSVKQYSLLSSEQIAELEKVFSETLNEVTKGEDNHYFHVQISPRFSKSDVNWDTIGGIKGKGDLLQKIETIKNIMISVSDFRNGITFDMDVRAAVGSFDIFDPTLPTLSVLEPGKCVMEVKFTEFLPQFVREILPDRASEFTAVSKYVICYEKTEYMNSFKYWHEN